MRNGSVLLLVVVLATSPAGACAQRAAPRASIRQVKAPTVRVQLLDAASARPLASTDVQVASDNGVRCIRAPCPTNGQSWSGRSDAGGYVVVPTSLLQASTSIRAGGASGDLVEDTDPGAGGTWVAELMPDDTAGLAPHPIKLVDARSGHAIANAAVRLEYQAPGGRSELRLTSNALGWIFVPFEVVARAADSSELEVPGYRRAHVDYAWVNRQMRLQKR